MNTVERIRLVCKERGIPISRLEKDLQFANGYISQLKKGHLPDDRLRLVSEYLDLSIDYLQYGKEKEPTEASSFIEQMKAIESRLSPEQQKLILDLANNCIRN
jgi:transcriptional regulator with XRE-family HTH domain